MILGFNSGPVHLCLSISFYTQTLLRSATRAAAAVSLPLVAQGGGGGSDCCNLIRTSRPCTDSHGTEWWRLVQKL